MTEREITREIKGCAECECRGITSKEQMVDYHKRDYDIIHSVCVVCGGAGRVVEVTEIVRIRITYETCRDKEWAVSSKVSIEKLTKDTLEFYKERLK